MQDTKFDSFGEPLAKGLTSDSQQRGNTSRWVMLAGTSVFWSMVVVILSARAVYFDPDFAAKFERLAELPRTLLALLGV